jgi:hypothetical protein
MWRMGAESAQDVCQIFVSLSLATLSAGDIENRMVKLHNLQLQYSGQQCASARTPSLYSARALVPECISHMRIMDGLLVKASVPMVFDDSTDVGSLTGGLQAYKPGPRHMMH